MSPSSHRYWKRPTGSTDEKPRTNGHSRARERERHSQSSPPLPMIPAGTAGAGHAGGAGLLRSGSVEVGADSQP